MQIDDLTIPRFLDRRPRDENDKVLPMSQWPVNPELQQAMDEMSGRAPRVWAPIRSVEEIAKRERVAAKKEERGIFPSDPKLPVQVVTTNKENLQIYPDFETFEKFHDFDDFPFKQTFTAGDITYIVVKVLKILSIDDSKLNVELNIAGGGEQNGVKRPKPNSLTGRAWAMYDQTLEGTMTIGQAQAVLADAGMNPSTIRTQYAHWRKFNGIAK